MYHRDLETDRDAKAAYDKNQQAAAADRMKQVKAKMKLKKSK